MPNIYIKTEPAGRVIFGELKPDQIADLNESLKIQEITEEIFELHKSDTGHFLCFEGVFNTGEDGEHGNVGLIELVHAARIEIPVDKSNNKPKDGIYIILLSLTKASIEFDFSLPIDESFDPVKLTEVSVPVRLPKCINHPIYGQAEFNIVTDFKYCGKIIEEYDRELCDRGYDDLLVIAKVNDGKIHVVYESYNGNERWL
jgi:hypothetical protein